jgi:hypothetical protein
VPEQCRGEGLHRVKAERNQNGRDDDRRHTEPCNPLQHTREQPRQKHKRHEFIFNEDRNIFIYNFNRTEVADQMIKQQRAPNYQRDE